MPPQERAPCDGFSPLQAQHGVPDSIPGCNAALRYDERARREAALTGRRPQPSGAAVTRRPCGDPIKKALSARDAARRQLRMPGDAVRAHDQGEAPLKLLGL